MSARHDYPHATGFANGKGGRDNKKLRVKRAETTAMLDEIDKLRGLVAGLLADKTVEGLVASHALYDLDRLRRQVEES